MGTGPGKVHGGDEGSRWRRRNRGRARGVGAGSPRRFWHRSRSRVARIRGDDETITELLVLAGYDDDLAGQSTRLTNRLRDALLHVHPALERLLGARLDRAGVLELLAAPTPGALAELGADGIAELMAPRSPQLARTLPAAHRSPRPSRTAPHPTTPRPTVPPAPLGHRDVAGDATRPSAPGPHRPTRWPATEVGVRALSEQGHTIAGAAELLALRGDLAAAHEQRDTARAERDQARHDLNQLRDPSSSEGHDPPPAS